jgi:pimeloyl-ACP methyl ester carboxylesterase
MLSPEFRATLLLLSLCGAACGQASPTGLRQLHACTGDEGPADALCGSLEVFEHRQAAAGRRLSLAIVVLPATSDDYRADPVVFLAGGPGQGAARLAPLIQAVFGRLQRHRDIVLVDQRGTGRSHPLECRTTDETLRAEFPDDPSALARLKECLESYDADVRQYTTPIAMDDLEDVRAFLGYERVNLYGASYGTRAALVFLRQHPSRVRTITLDGVAPPDMRLPLFAARDASRALEQVLSDCQNEQGCGDAYPDLRARTVALLARLERAPATVHVRHPRTGRHEPVEVTPRVATGALVSALYTPVTASTIPLLLHRATQDDFAPLLAMALAGDDSTGISVGMQLSVLCSEDVARVDAAAVERESASSLFGAHLAAGPLTACRDWPRGALPSGYFDPVRSDVPALILSGDLDPVTPPDWGEHVAQHLTNGRHYVARGTGHGVASTACGLRVVEQFLERASAVDLDAACLDEPQRPFFFVSPSGPDPLAREPGRR